jgi:hypothetical protein
MESKQRSARHMPTLAVTISFRNAFAGLVKQAGRDSPGRRRAQYNPDRHRDGNHDDDIGQRIPHALLNTAKAVNIQCNEG